MKNYQALKCAFICAFLSVLFFGYSNSFSYYFPDCSQQVFPQCYDANCPGATAWWRGETTIEFPEWPGCVLHIEYCARQCNWTPHATQWSITGVWMDNSCLAFWNWIHNNGTELDPTKWRDTKLRMVRKISLDLFNSWYAQSPQEIKDMVKCNTGYHTKSTYWEASCMKVCSVMQLINGQPVYSLSQVACVDVDYCCGVEYKFCVNDQGQTEITETATGHNATCYASPYPDPTGCPPGVDVEVTFCRDNCLLP